MGQAASKAGVWLLLVVTVLAMGGCGNRSNGGREVPDPEPTVTPLVEVAAIPTFTPTVAPTEAIPTEMPTQVPTSTLVPSRTHTNIRANLRSGPGVAFNLVEVLAENTEVVPVSQTRDREWLKLDSGGWIFADLVDGIPLGLPVEVNPPTPPPPTVTPTPVPPTEVPATNTPVPTRTPVSVRGDWSLPISRDTSFLMRDGLEIKVQNVIPGNDAQIQRYIERRGGQNCDGCLAIEIEVSNKEGNSKEYLVQEDFRLLHGGLGGKEYRQVRCSNASGMRSMDNPGSLQALVKGVGSDERTLCFEDVVDSLLEIRLAYSPKFLYQDPNTPTPTPTKSTVVYATEPLEKEQKFRTGWSVFFLLLGI